ncbi:MAG: poly-gamma-glutamate biosynthesis protein [Ruminococcaceae bacterium]|nr:poly-gamma-glutamate biosynthesis protein [Oscillospiraceae bacterium]
MISTKKDLIKVLQAEKMMYLPRGSKFESILTSDNKYKIYLYLVALRKTEYHYNNRNRLFHKLLYLMYRRRKNILGRRLGLEISENSFAAELMIHHSGNIVVNGYARIGKQCILHGNNCIGNDGKSFDAPILGERVRLGVGAKVIGNVTIADDVVIAAGAVVVESCLVRGAVLAGVPAKCIKVNSVDFEVN